MPASEPRLRPDSLELVTDAFTVAFGGWAVVSSLTAIFGGTPQGSLRIGASVLVALLLVIAVSVWKRARWIAPYLQDAADSEPTPLARLGLWQRVLLIVATALPVALWLRLESVWAVWYAVVAVSVLFALIALRQWPASPPPGAQPAPTAADPRWLPWVVHGLAFACALFTLASFRPRSDDAFYVKMAVTIADYPHLPLFSRDMIHGPATPDLAPQVLFPPYRVHAFESLGGFIAYCTGIEAIVVLHLGLATFFGWLTPIAVARALRMLAPRGWLLGLLATLAYYMIEGSAARGWSNQAFVRLFNGKSAMLTVGVPLLIVYGVRFARKPSGVRFGLLVLAQSVVVGLSSTGIWLAPVLAGLAVAASTPSARKALVTLPLGALSSAYVVGVGLWVRGQMAVGPIGAVVAKGAGKSGPDAGLGLLAWVTGPMLGHQPTIIATLCLFGLAAALAQSAIVLRLFALLGLLLSVLLANPWFAKLVAAAMTGKLTYERIFWLVPIPLALGIACSALYALLRARMPRPLAALLAILAVAGFLTVATERLVIGKENMAQLRWPPTVKDWDRASRTARVICARTTKEQTVLVPKTLAHSVANLHDCGHPVIAEMRWMQAPLVEERRRNAMEAVVAGMPYEHDMRAFAAGLERYDVSLVALKKEAWGQRPTESVLRRQGFERTDRVTMYELWARESAERRQRNDAIAQGVCSRVVAPSEVVLAPFAISRAVARAGCAVAPLAASGELSTEAAAMELFELEDALATRLDLDPERQAWVDGVLARNAAAIVVLGPDGIRNRALKEQLAASGYDKALTISGYHIYRKRSPHAAAAAPEPAPGAQPAPGVQPAAGAQPTQPSVARPAGGG